MIKWNYELPEKEIAGRRCLVACENVHNNNQHGIKERFYQEKER